MRQTTILVTGCAGFIGSNFVDYIRKHHPKLRVVGIDNFATGRRDRVNSEIEFHEASITDPAALKKIFQKFRPDIIFHFAAIPRVSYSVEHPAETTYNNIYGTVLLLEYAKDFGVKRFIYSSSSSVYGGAKKLPTKESENPADPVSPYAIQKYAGEPFCKIFSSLYGLDTVSLRYFNVFGPWQYGDSPYSTVISAWLDAVYFPRKKKPFLEGDGKQSRDFCYVENVIQANLLAMKKSGRLNGQVLNVAHGERTSLLKVKTLIEKMTGKKLQLEHRPSRLGDVRHSLADIRAARSVLGYRPTVNFEEGLRRMIAWYKAQV